MFLIVFSFDGKIVILVFLGDEVIGDLYGFLRIK